MTPEENIQERDDYYQILECEKTASADELRKSYQRLALLQHPDKSKKADSNFYLLQKAWAVLRDPESRKQYDAELFRYELSECLLYATIRLSDMLLYLDTYTYSCRCGGEYVLEKSEIKSKNIMIPCDECSFSVMVKLDGSSN